MERRKSHEHLIDGQPVLLTLKEAADEVDMMLTTLCQYIEDDNGPNLYEIDGELLVSRDNLTSWINGIESSLRSNKQVA